MATKPKLGIVAGAGLLPRRLIEHCRDQGRAFFVFAIEGHAEAESLSDVPHAWIKLGRTGDSIAIAKREGVEEIVMAGGVRRPSFSSLLPDATTLRILGKAGGAAFSGDDGLLRAVIRYLEDQEGLKVVGIDTLLDDLLPEVGTLTQCAPDADAWRDIERGRGILDLFSAADVGQSVVIQESLVLGIEAIEGTDGLVERCAALRRPGPGGVLVKMRKRGQERRVDLPTIGVTTVHNVARAGLRGIALEARGSIIVDRESTVRAADEAGLFIVAIERDETGDTAPTSDHGGTRNFYLIAGEASGDVIGARLMHALGRETDQDIRFHGVGGDMMRRAGLKSLFEMSEISLMGLTEVLPHIPRLRRRIKQTAANIVLVRPDALITIDAPGFCKRVVDALPPEKSPIKIHYVAPTVWAWRPGRVKGFRKRFDALLTLLPFEPPYFDKVGLDARFVGHPVLQSGADNGDGVGFRARHGIDADTPVLCLLLGSRLGEVTRLMDPFVEAAKMLGASVTDLKIVVPTFPSYRERIEAALNERGLGAVFVEREDERYDAMAASNVAIAASGTVALELALARVPSVIGYRVSRITYEIVRRLININHVHLLNYMAGRAIVPELLQSECTAARLAEEAGRLLGPDGERQTTELTPILKDLAPTADGVDLLPSQAAARAVLDIVKTYPGTTGTT